MAMLLGMTVGTLVVVAVGRRLRDRSRWVSPYAHLAQAMRTVTRTDESEFRAAAGLVGLRPAPVASRAVVLDLDEARAVRHREPIGV